jgi:hypothetical protein
LVHLERDDCEAAIKTLESIPGKGAVGAKHFGEDVSVAVKSDSANATPVQAALKLARERLPNSKRFLRTFEGHAEMVFSVCLSGDGRFALSGSWDKTLKLWEVATGRCLRTFEGHASYLRSVCLSGDGFFALSGSYDKTLKLWDVATGRCLRTFEGHTSYLRSVCLSGDGFFALSGSWDETLKLWVLDWELEHRHPADWDEGARPLLEAFLKLHTPYIVEQRGLFRRLIAIPTGTPTWSEEEFQGLLHTLGCAGYDWLRPEGVRRQLEAMAGISAL